MSSINLQESQLSGCEKYIAIVVDESGSISPSEAQQIKTGLASFINSQEQSNITLSLIGMSNSDTAVRSDNVIQKKISDHKQEFLDWIDLFGNGRVTVQSDYWASGLNVAKNLAVTPDIVFVITDGVQVNNSELLKNLFADLNLKSHVFVYGVTSAEDNIDELTTPLNTFLDRSIQLKDSRLTALESDYLRVPDFSNLETELNKLIRDLSIAQIGCISNVSIIENKIVYPVLKKGKRIKELAGTLVFKNKSRVALSLSAGTRIHAVSNLNGLIFKLQNAVTIPGSGQIEAAVRIEGKPSALGNFSALISINDVKNNNGFSINFNVGKESSLIDITSSKTNLQSTYLQIAAAGSKGVDSTKGIHLRWMLAGKLGEKHLPKGDLYTGVVSNFNKPDDFVKVYRAPYVKKSHVLDLSQKPNVIDNQKGLWIYKTLNSKRSIYVSFLDTKKYKLVKLNVDPLTNPVDFIQAYGNNLIEIENKSELFFAAELNFSSSVSSSLKLETLSVAENSFTAPKRVSNRKTYSSNQLENIRLVAENGRSIRFKANNCLLNSVHFEFYSDFITQANTNGDWTLKGKYGLSNNDLKVFEQLEPKLNAVHGKWLKYNDGEYVNIANYKDKWNRITDNDDIADENIKEILNQYILLSEKPGNPTAEKSIPFGDRVPVNEPQEGEIQEYAENLTDVSYLDLLNIAANDYHIARMLGLGCIDIDNEVLSGDFVYLTEYSTFGDLEDGAGATEKIHLSMSIPTSLNTERQPLPVQLSKIIPGLNIDAEEAQSAQITDSEGYSFDGKKRYLSLFMDDVMDYGISKDKNDFFKSTVEYDGSSFTFPIYLGVNFKTQKDTAGWRKPELSNDLDYKNVNQNLEESFNEPVPIIIPESGKSIFNIRQGEVGENVYIYQGYGINIFSRATTGRQISIKSDIKPANNLMPPSNINSLLITKENPLMFTSASEQQLLNSIIGDDKTLIRILFDYYSVQELISYTVPAGMSVEEAEQEDSIFPDREEIFADHFKLYYKDGLPDVEYASIDEIQNNPQDNLTSIIKIKEYKVLSTGQEIKVSLTEDNKTKYDGGILTIGDQNYVVKNIEVFTKTENLKVVFDYALIEVLKKEVSDSYHADGNATIDSDQIKDIKIPENKLCTLVQNMLTPCNWHKPQIEFKVEYPPALNAVHREVILHKNENKSDLNVEKTRGIWETAVIERVLENTYEMNSDGKYKLDEDQNLIKLDDQKHLGLYKIIFQNFNLPQHHQYKTGNENSVEWFNGIVRLFRKSAVTEESTIPVESRKEFKVVRTEKEELTGNLVLVVNDTDFKLENFIDQTMHPDYDEIIVGTQDVNYYPSYRVYLYADQISGIAKENILPREKESTHYSIFGISTRAVRPTFEYKSKISVPSPMYAVKIEEPVKPEEITGGSLYATRPDFYNRSTFTFTTKYKKDRKPYGALHYRANEENFFSVLYKRETINTIRKELKKLGGNDEIQFTDRWKNFLNFNELAADGSYKKFPENEPETNFGFPLPDNEEFINLINDFIEWHNETQKPLIKAQKIVHLTGLNQVLISTQNEIETDLLAVHFIEEAIQSAFVPLTEVPVIYEHIKGAAYTPTNKKQTIKDKNGHALKPTDADFDIAPMMKIINEDENITQFTDFNLDGNSESIYFYAVREMDIKMNFSQFSDLLGPVKLVSSTPPKMPEIKRIMPILENQVLGIKPSIQFELNAYQAEKIRKINIYRADSMQKAQSIRTMTPVKEVLITEETLSNEFDNVWTVYDDFEDLESVPFGEGLFYRITVSKEIEYADPDSTLENPIINIDYAPSQPSKITATIIADNVSPESPLLEGSVVTTGTNGEILKPVIFTWEKTVHNGKYHLYKMNNQGNWEKIHEKVSNDINVNASLLETKLGTDELVIKNEDGERIYHHFKVISENSSGMFSTEEKILTL